MKLIVRNLQSLGLSALAVALIASAAQAHFVWFYTVPVEGKGYRAELAFSEEPAPDRASLIDRMGHATSWQRDVAGNRRPIVLAERIEDGKGVLAGEVATNDSFALESQCMYGIFDHGPKPIMLYYYARHIKANTLEDAAALASARIHPLEIIAVHEGGRPGRIRVEWLGQPLTQTEVTVADAEGKEQKIQTNDAGEFHLPQNMFGGGRMLVSYTEKDRKGDFHGAEYEAVSHYLTVTFTIGDRPAAGAPNQTAATRPATPAAAPAEPEAGTKKEEVATDPAAMELLAKSRAARALWDDFPGFEATVTVCEDNGEVKGKLRVTEFGDVELELPEGPQLAWAQRQLGSLVQHRMPSSDLTSKARFIKEEGDHPLGQLLELSGDGMGSRYRIDGDVVRQVNREMGAQKFTITVIDVERNGENKYYPTLFTVSFWDGQSGELKSQSVVKHLYEEVGGFDLPCEVVEVSTGRGAYNVRTMKLEGVKLLK